MSILSDFEDRLARGVEGLFAGAFRSPVQPAELAKTLAKAMDDGRVVGVGAVYAPVRYTVALSPEDADKLGSFTATLSRELSTYLADHAREAAYTLAGAATIEFTVHDDLRLGRFRVSSELAPAEEPQATPSDSVPPAPSPAEEFAPGPQRGAAGQQAYVGLATVTVGELQHDVVLRGDRMSVGRLAGCDICLSDANASREHAAFVALPEGGWAVEDLESTNGTFVNGQRVDRQPLSDGDVIEMGVTRLVYHGPGGRR